MNGEPSARTRQGERANALTHGLPTSRSRPSINLRKCDLALGDCDYHAPAQSVRIVHSHDWRSLPKQERIQSVHMVSVSLTYMECGLTLQAWWVTTGE